MFNNLYTPLNNLNEFDQLDELIKQNPINEFYKSQLNIIESTDSEYYDYFNQLIFNGIDWIYLTTESIYNYNFKVWYISDCLTVFNNSCDLFFYQYWFLIISTSLYQLFYSVILDMYINNFIINNVFANDWFKVYLYTKESSIIWLYHPELLWHINQINSYFMTFYTSSEFFSIFNKNQSEVFILTHTLYIHIIFFIIYIGGFVTLLFSFYGNQNNEENIIDNDYLNNSLLVESEKEITSIDDYLVLLFTVAYVFGFYFYLYSFISILNQSNILIVYYSICIMFIFILGMPTLLLYDLGIYFLVYLKGSGKSSQSLQEVIYDYIACIVFYTRIFAQWIRLVLMFVTYISLSHYVIEFELTNNTLILNENNFQYINDLNYYNSSITYYILTVLPGKFFYWCYEILHTLFLVTSQFIAFFAIVFWLILFLYTFFIIEKHENFFFYKRKQRSLKMKSILNLKYNL